MMARNSYVKFQNFPMPNSIFRDFPGPEKTNEKAKNFQGAVATLEKETA